MDKTQALNKLRSLRLETMQNDYDIQGLMSREQNPNVKKQAEKNWQYNRKKITRELNKIQKWIERC